MSQHFQTFSGSMLSDALRAERLATALPAERNFVAVNTAVKLDNVRTEHTLTLTQPDGGLVVRCVGIEYADFPAVEWTVYFRNNGPTASPILENIQTLDGHWQRSGEGEFLLHHAVGSPATKNDYGPRETPLRAALWSESSWFC